MKQATPRAGVGGLSPFPHPFLESTGPPCQNPSDSTRTRRGWTGSIRPLEMPGGWGGQRRRVQLWGQFIPKSPHCTLSLQGPQNCQKPWPPSRKPPFQRTEDFMSQGAVGRPVATPPDVFRGRRIEAGIEHTECVPVHTHTRVSKTHSSDTLTCVPGRETDATPKHTQPRYLFKITQTLQNRLLQTHRGAHTHRESPRGPRKHK